MSIRISEGKVPNPACPCPRRIVLDGVTVVSPDGVTVPQEGQPTICGYCSRILRFQDQGTKLVEADEDEVLAAFKAQEDYTYMAFKVILADVRKACGYTDGRRPPKIRT